jgi:hypothetical protein
MKNLHTIGAGELTPTQLGILNYYDRQVDKVNPFVSFYPDGKVQIRYDGFSSFSWARWDNKDWIPYIKSIGVIKPLSQLRVRYEIKP